VETFVKSVFKAFIPQPYRLRLRQKLSRYLPIDPVEKEFTGLSNREIFEKIYRKKLWGNNPDGVSPFYSGYGSHNPEIVKQYLDAIHSFLDTFRQPQLLVDLGCGDFNIGSRIAPRAEKYIACDLVADVIEHSKKQYSGKNIEFMVLDLVNDELPNADIFLVRQVLQHLTNSDIKNFCSKIKNHCSYLVLTEHLPASSVFRPNLDKPSGADNRLMFDSGVVLSAEPFNLTCKSEEVLCESSAYPGVIRTTLYCF